MASGFGIYEWSGRGNGMGGATYANAKDASTVATNPSGMTDLEGTHVLVGTSAIAPKAVVDTNGFGSTTGKYNTWVIPHGYVTHQLNDKFWLGAGVYSRFGLGTEFEDDWAGRFNLLEAMLETVSFTPQLAYKINDEWSVAGGPEFMYMHFVQSKVVDHNPFNGRNVPNVYTDDTHAKLDGDSMNAGFNLSVTYRPTDWLTGALTYRSQIRQSLTGSVSFAKIGAGAAANLGPGAFYGTDTDAQGDIVVPDSWTLGVAVKPLDKLTVEADVLWTRWSSYQELRIEYGAQLAPGVATSNKSVSEKAWRDTWRYQIGAEYELYDWLDLRCGYIYDQSPIQSDHADYMVPANDRQLYSLGAGLHWEQWTMDLSYIYLQSKAREYNNRLNAEGVIAGEAHDLETHIVGVSVGYTF